MGFKVYLHHRGKYEFFGRYEDVAALHRAFGTASTHTPLYGDGVDENNPDLLISTPADPERPLLAVRV